MKFKAGQKVRCVSVKPDSPRADLLGKEGIFKFYEGDFWGTDATPGVVCEFGTLIVFFEYQLEPIIDPGREVISWESMRELWTPDKETV
jgi:hypothetical protein